MYKKVYTGATYKLTEIPENIDDLFKIKKANFYAKNPAYVNELTKIENDYAMLKSIARKASFVKRNEIKINGKEFFAKGANWIPADVIIPRITREKYHKLAKSKGLKLSQLIVKLLEDA